MSIENLVKQKYKEVAFIDTEGKVYNDFYSYGDKITYQINYESDEDSTVYVVMAYYS